MKILIAMNSFKGSLTSLDACNTVKEAALKLSLDNKIIPIVDGGTGSLEAWSYLFKLPSIKVNSLDPLGKKIESKILYCEEKKEAYIEMALASGIDLIKVSENTILESTTYGTGLLVLEAIRVGARTINLGIGGSATHDLGTGILRALGVRFLDKYNNELRSPNELLNLHKVDDSALISLPNDLKINFLCDVNNTLLGKDGAAEVYAPQKGAFNRALIDKCEELSKTIVSYYKNNGINIGDKESDGAAGGLPSIIRVLLNTSVKPGINLISEVYDLEEVLKNVDLILTGEGSFDKQSYYGKGPGYIINKGTENNIPVVVLTGNIDVDTISEDNIFFFQINKKIDTIDTLIRSTKANLFETAYNVLKLCKLK
jgi:glycerate kinase